jgi:mannose-1-phosphate guanylyltransferase
MKVCIMCGGEGTRLRPLTFERPKPCIPIAGIPSIQHLVVHLADLGFTDIVITLGYLGDRIREALGDGSLYSAEITYVEEKTKLGTAGSVKNAQEYLDGTPFLVVGGDHVTDINLLEFYREHTKSGAITSIGLIGIDDPSEYGIAEIDATFTIQRFKEKPAPGEIFSNLASTGMYVCNPEIFDHIPAGRKFDFARDLFPALMNQGYMLKGWLARGNWTDVGSPSMLRQAERWKLNEVGITTIQGTLNVQNAQITGPVRFGDSITLGARSRVIGPVSIGKGVTIGEDVIIGPYTSIGDNCTMNDQTKIFSSSIYSGVSIGTCSTISGSIIDNDVTIGDHCSIEHDTVIGPRAILRAGVVVHSRTRLWPEVNVKEGEVVKEYVLNDTFDTRCDGS